MHPSYKPLCSEAPTAHRFLSLSYARVTPNSEPLSFLQACDKLIIIIVIIIILITDMQHQVKNSYIDVIPYGKEDC